MKPTFPAIAMVAAISGLAQANDGWGSAIIDLSGYEFRDELGSPNNEILEISILPEARISCIVWDLTLTTYTAPGSDFPSWGSEANIDFNGEINLQVSDTPSGVVNENNAGSVNVDFTLGSDGILSLEFWDSFVDIPGAADAVLQEGSFITIYGFWAPSPGPLAAMGLGGLFAAKRRRLR